MNPEELKANLPFYLKNLDEAERMIVDLPSEAIIKDLVNFRTNGERPSCKAPACFGGWIAVDPYFQSLGVWPGRGDGIPVKGGLVGSQVSSYLFGNRNLFVRRGRPGECSLNLSDKEIILWRIKCQRENLLAEAQKAAK